MQEVDGNQGKTVTASVANPMFDNTAQDVSAKDSKSLKEHKVPPLLNWTTGFAIAFFALASAIAVSFLGNLGFLYFVTDLQMSSIWFANVTVFTSIVGNILTLVVSQAGDNLSGYWARFGRRKPFILLSLPFYVIALLMVSAKISSQSLNFVYLLIALFAQIGGVLYSNSLGSWYIESARDNDDYNNITTVGFIPAILGSTAGGILTQAPDQIAKLAPIIAILLVVSYFFLLYLIPARVLKQAPKMPPLVPSFRQCVRTKEFRSLFVNEVLLQISAGGVGNLIIIIFYTAFKFSDTKVVNNYVAPVFLGTLVTGVTTVIVTSRLIARGWEKITIYKNLIMTHAILGVVLFALLIPSLVNFYKDVPAMVTEMNIFMIVFVLSISCVTPVVFIQVLLTKDLVNFDHFLNKKRRENVYQTALRLPAGLISQTVVGLLQGILFATGYNSKAKSDNSGSQTIQQLYSYNYGTVAQCCAYVLIFSFGIGLLAWYIIKDYPLQTPLANKIAAAIELREKKEDEEHEAKQKVGALEDAYQDSAESAGSHSGRSSKSIETLDVTVPFSAEEEEITMLHLSALECEVISESEVVNSRNDGLTQIRSSSYLSSGVFGMLALGWLIAGGVQALEYQSIFIQIIFVVIQALLIYLGYEFSRATVIHKLNHLDQDYVKQISQRQVDRNKKYSVTLQGLMDAAGISLNELDKAEDETFARMTLSSKTKSSRILEPIEDEEQHHALAGYNRVYLCLALTTIGGILSTFLIGGN